MTGIIVKGLVMFAIALVVRGVLLFVKEEKPTANKVHLPKLFFWVGVIGTMIFAGAILCMYISPSFFTGATWAVFGLLMFVIMGLSLISACVNWHIVYSGTGFEYKTFLGKVYTFGYQDIENIKRSNNAIYIYTKAKRLVIDPYAIGIEEFFDEINRHPFKQASTVRKKTKR